MGPSQEDAMEGERGTIRLGEVLSRGDKISVVVWGRYLSIVKANGAETRGSSCGVNDTGEEV